MPAREGSGRKPFRPTSEQRRQVEIMSGLGLPTRSIATLIDGGIGHTTLQKYFRDELDRGKARMMLKATKRLTELMMDDKTLLIFYLKTQCGWSETSKIEHAGADGGPMRVKVEIVDVDGAKIKSNIKAS